MEASSPGGTTFMGFEIPAAVIETLQTSLTFLAVYAVLYGLYRLLLPSRYPQEWRLDFSVVLTLAFVLGSLGRSLFA